MTVFIKKICYFSIPFICILFLSIYIDFFKIFGFRKDYYENNLIGINREMICTKTYNHYRNKEKFDSFIFGSSRSQAFKCKNWSKHLSNDAKPFHFDASGESIWGISKKIEYIAELGDTINNALLILDRKLLRMTENKKDIAYIAMPSVSKESNLEYYLTYFKATINLKFIIAYIDYSIFNSYRSYMKSVIHDDIYRSTANYVNCDLWYGYDNHIKNDSAGYYNERIEKGVFLNRLKYSPSTCKITGLEIKQLNTIKDIFTRHNTKYKIVVSPVYDQVPMEQEQLDLLFKIFGENNVYNFSGKNEFTEPISNYYEDSHFRPHVANKIMDSIYQYYAIKN